MHPIALYLLAYLINNNKKMSHFWCNEMPHESVQTNKQKKYKNSQAQAKPEQA